MKYGSSPRDTDNKTKVKFESYILPEDIAPFNCNVDLFFHPEYCKRSNEFFCFEIWDRLAELLRFEG